MLWTLESSATLSITVVTRTHVEHFHHPKTSNGLCLCSGEKKVYLLLKYRIIKYKNRYIYKVWKLNRGDATYMILQRSKGEEISQAEFLMSRKIGSVMLESINSIAISHEDLREIRGLQENCWLIQGPWIEHI